MSVISSASVPVLVGMFGCLLVSLVTALAIFDITRMILPDPLNILLGAIGIGQSALLGLPTPMDAALGALLGGGLLALTAFGFYRIRGLHGLGFGDVKFVAAAGLWIGWQGVPLMLCISSISALSIVALFSMRDGKWETATRLPFGPFLGAGTVLSWLLMVNS